MTASPTRHHPPGHPRGPGIPGALWRMVAGIARILGRLLRGLAALAVLVALVAALPWALWHYIGWPLPGHLPTGDEVVAVLGSPMTTPLLLDVLACLCWIAWAAFVIDVARCVLAAARGLRWPELPTVGPVHAVAAILVGVIALSLLGNRSPSGAGAGITEVTSGHGVLVATAPAHSSATPREQPVVVVTTPALTATVTAYPDAPAAPAPLAARTVVVRAPENGIHDTLSRIAARTLDDARRWPEIFQANRGKPQPHGGTLTNPNLIFPGEWLVLPPNTPAIPPTSLPVPVGGGHHDGAPSAVPTPPAPLAPTTPPSPPSRPSTSPHATPVAASASSRGSGPGIGWEPGVFVGLSLAAAVSAALLVARRRARCRYRPGSGRRDDLPVAPVVYQLRLAHLRAEHDDSDPDDSGGGGNGPGTNPPLLVVPTAPDLGTPAGGGTEVRAAPGLGVRDGREVALDLAVACGLGLVGPGAAAAVRALLLAMLAPPPHPGSLRGPAPVGTARVIVPAEDLTLVLGPEHTHAQLPDAVSVVTDLDAALDELETEILHRAREQHPTPGSAWPVITLVARPPAQSTQRLQAVLDNGAHLGLVGIILGQWRPGVSTYIRADGTVSATSPGPGEALKGTRMFHMPHAETVELLALLRHAQPNTPGPTPIAPDHPTPSTVQAHRIEDPPLPSTEPPDGNAPTALDAHDGAAVNDTALEVTTIPSAEPEGIGPRLVPDPAPHREPGPAPSYAAHGDRQPHHGHAHQAAEQTTTAPRCSPVAPGHQPGHRDAPATPITLTVLGRPRVHWTPDPTGEDGTAADTTVRDITGAFPPRQRELLVFLAVHPDGVHRDALVGRCGRTTHHSGPPTP
ncbi:MAG: transcriptional regulator [Pseudonocardiaceae bacterium]